MNGKESLGNVTKARVPRASLWGTCLTKTVQRGGKKKQGPCLKKEGQAPGRKLDHNKTLRKKLWSGQQKEKVAQKRWGGLTSLKGRSKGPLLTTKAKKAGGQGEVS